MIVAPQIEESKVKIYVYLPNRDYVRISSTDKRRCRWNDNHGDHLLFRQGPTYSNVMQRRGYTWTERRAFDNLHGNVSSWIATVLKFVKF